MKGTNDSHIFLEGLQPGFRLDPRTVSVNRIPVSEVCAATRAALGVWRIDRRRRLAVTPVSRESLVPFS